MKSDIIACFKAFENRHIFQCQCQPASGRFDEGTAGGDDRPERPRGQGLVPEQTLQGEEKVERRNQGETAGGKLWTQV